MKQVETPPCNELKVKSFEKAIMQILGFRRSKGFPKSTISAIESSLSAHPSESYRIDTTKYLVLALARLTIEQIVTWDEDSISLAVPF
jgi:hypothetical protein